MKITIKRKLPKRKVINRTFGTCIAVLGFVEFLLIKHAKETNDNIVKLNSKIIESEEFDYDEDEDDAYLD